MFDVHATSRDSFPRPAGRFHNFELTQNRKKTRNGLVVIKGREHAFFYSSCLGLLFRSPSNCFFCLPCSLPCRAQVLDTLLLLLVSCWNISLFQIHLLCLATDFLYPRSFSFIVDVACRRLINYCFIRKNRFKNRKGRVALKHLSMMVKVFSWWR
jgi:hypothetical protein